MKIILTAIYVVTAALTMLCGGFYPAVWAWSCMATCACAIYLALSLVVSVRTSADAGKIAAWCWHGLSTLVTLVLLLIYVMSNEGLWFLAAAALTAFSLIVTLVFALVLKPDPRK